jgi:hypothetical protein
MHLRLLSICNTFTILVISILILILFLVAIFFIQNLIQLFRAMDNICNAIPIIIRLILSRPCSYS